MAAAGSALPPDIAAQDKGPAIVAACVSVTVLSTIFVAARLFVRARIMGQMFLDDYFMAASVVCSWATVAASIEAVSHGTGRHFAVLSQEQISKSVMWTMIGFCPGVTSFALPKLAVVALLTRMMNPARWHAILMWAMAILCLVSLMGCIGILFGQCTPTRSMWDISVKGECWSPWVLVNYSIYAGSFSAFVDLYLAVYPALVLFNLQLNMKKKIALSCALGIGSVASIVAIYKTTRLPGLASPDFAYDTADLTIWTAIESSTIMIAASIPVLKPLTDIVFGRRTFSSNKSGQRYEKYGRSSQSGQGHDTDVELSRSAGGRSHKRDQQSGGGTATAHLDTVVVVGSASCEADRASNKSDANDSQVGILPPPRPLTGGIMRTDLVTVTTSNAYEAEADRKFSVSRWD